MAKKKPTPYQKQIESLAKTYQASISSLGPEYDKVFQEKEKKLASYNTAIERYNRALSNYSQQLSDFQENKVVEWVRANVAATTTSSRGVVQNYIDVPTWFEDYSRSKYMPSGETYSGRLGAEGMIARGGTPIKQEGGAFYLGRLAQMPKEFTSPEPKQPDFSKIDQQLEGLESKKQGAKQTLERETTERRSARLRAVSQGSRERPMLSRGVKLNG